MEVLGRGCVFLGCGGGVGHDVVYFFFFSLSIAFQNYNLVILHFFQSFNTKMHNFLRIPENMMHEKFNSNW